MFRAGARPATGEIVAFLDAYGETYGVEPICAVLRDAGLQVAPSTYYAARHRRPSARSVRDDELCQRIQATWDTKYKVYGARKVWRQLLRDGENVARCTVERLMRRLGLQGARRGKLKRTTVSDPNRPQPDDLLKRNFTAAAPNTRRVADYTYVPIEGRTVYVAFVTDLYARVIVGWRRRRTRRPRRARRSYSMRLVVGWGWVVDRRRPERWVMAGQ